MKTRIISFLFGAILCFTAGCGISGTSGQSDTTAPEPEAIRQNEAAAATESREREVDGPGDYKIGILTGSQLLFEEEYRAAAQMRALYGGRIVTAAYPDTYPDDPAIVVSSAINLAADPMVRVIVIAQAPPGTIEAVERIRRLRDDVLFICGAASEPPEEIAAAADIVLQADDVTMGASIVRQAAAMGAEAFVHYGYPRRLESPLAAARRDRMLETCEAEGLRFLEVETPDPAGDYGVTATTRFLETDIPQQLERYGANTAFFGTDPVMQETLIRGVMEGGAVFPLQCNPSPALGYPGALGFRIPDDRLTDTGYVVNRILERLDAWTTESDEEETSSRPGDEASAGGYRLSTWDINVNALIIESGVRYGIGYCEENISGFDDSALRRILSETASEYGGTAIVTTYKTNEALENFFLIRGEYVTF